MNEKNNYDDRFYHREQKYIIDTETGKKYPRSRFEVVPETRDFKKMKLEEIKNGELGEGFFHLITEMGTNLVKRFDVSFEDLGKLIVLFTYTNYRNGTGGVMYLKYHNNVHYMDNKKMGEVLKLNPKQTRDFKSKMKRKGILNEDTKTKRLYFTDDVLIRGKIFPIERKSLSYIRVYDEPIRNLYDLMVVEGQSKTSKGLGVLLCLLPFMHKDKNILITSEWLDDEQRYRPMSNAKVAEALGIDRHVLSRNIATMNNQLIRKIGEPLVYDVTVKAYGVKDDRFKKSGLLINPKYSYNSNTSSYDQLISEIERLVVFLPEIIT